MIKLQDFARETGVTDRAIQKHLKKYEKELEGLIERRGVNGTWLSDDACDFLRGKMKQAPVVVSDGEVMRRIAELEKENKELTAELKEAYKKQAIVLEKLGELQGVQARLEAAEKTHLELTELAESRADEAAQLRAELAAERAKPWYRKIFAKGE